jgi:BRCA1-associated protein
MSSSLQVQPQQAPRLSSSSRVRKRPVSFGNPALGTYKGNVYTIDSNRLPQPPQIIEDAEPVENMVAMVDVPPEQVPEGVLNLARSHRPFIDHVRIVIVEPHQGGHVAVAVAPAGTATEAPLVATPAAPGASAMESAASILAAESEELGRHQGELSTQQLPQQQQQQQQLEHPNDNSKPSRTYLVLFHLLQPEDAQTFVEDLNGQPFTSLDMTVTCSVHHVVALQGEGGVSLMNPMFAPSTKKAQHGALEILPSSSSEQELSNNSSHRRHHHHYHDSDARHHHHNHHHIGEDPNCAVCLERVALDPNCAVCLERVALDPNDVDKTSILTTVCNHTFHLACLVQCQDSPCPVCRYDHSGLNEALSQCHICGTTEHNYVCLICGVVSCIGSAATPPVAAAAGESTSCSETIGGSSVGHDNDQNETNARRFFNSHAGQHYDETLHAYALDTETQHVWDFCGQGYVHRLLQNKEDGKLVEVHDPNNTTSQERSLRPGLSDAQEGEVVHRKLEGFASQYYTLLKSQLEQQRIHYEGRLQEIRREFAVQQSDAHKNKQADLLTALKQERKELTHRGVTLNRRVQKLEENVYLKSMNESLEANKAYLELKIQHAQYERMESQQMIQMYLPALEQKVTSLMLQLEESTTATSTGEAKECAPDSKLPAARR